MLEALKQQVYQANMELPRRGLVTYTWGNVSGIDRAQGLVVIKPSGVEYDALTPDDLVVLDLDGRIVEGKLNPSSDTRTHLELYRAFPALGGIVHTHSAHAVGWAQAQRDIPCFGTTHADYFYGAVPCTRQLTEAEIDEDYERNTGKVIIETFAQRNLDPVAVPGVICASHGPFTWGKSAAQAVYHAVVLEEVARMALYTVQINPAAASAPQSAAWAQNTSARPSAVWEWVFMTPAASLTSLPTWPTRSTSSNLAVAAISSVSPMKLEVLTTGNRSNCGRALAR